MILLTERKLLIGDVLGYRILETRDYIDIKKRGYGLLHSKTRGSK